MSDKQPSAPLSMTSPARGVRLAPACMLVAAAMAVTACGGGVDVGPAPGQAKALAATATATATATGAVLFRGCVVDESFLPHEGVPVRVLAADGRLLGNARSGRSGEFQLRLPAGAHVALQVDAAGGESLSVQTQDKDQRFATCLQASAA